MKWARQGEAVVSSARLVDGAPVRVVLIGPRNNPKGAAVVVPSQGPEKVKTLRLDEALDRFTPQDVVEILCMQERFFGASGLSVPTIH
ncbi:MAG TPA: hypothetical protein PLN86_10235 [Candidatus Hydrogenedentes bacterium]|nr:hypothetical protein [Candidatus Hydrogenedentota bacterium]